MRRLIYLYWWAVDVNYLFYFIYLFNAPQNHSLMTFYIVMKKHV